MLESLLVYGGKGGVGKSSISTATAVYLAKLMPQKNILVISFDIAHNLSDLFNIEIGNKITQITPNLYAIEPDPEKYTEKYTGVLTQKARALLNSMPIVGKIPQLEQFINTTFRPKSIPLALKNAIFFQSIVDVDNPVKNLELDKPVEYIGKTGEEEKLPTFHIIVADFPPTGNMVALFEVPEDTIKHMLNYSLQMVDTISTFVASVKKVSKMINPFRIGRGNEAERQRDLAREILAILRDLEKRGERISDLMKSIGSLRLVGIPEKPAYEELIRAEEMCRPYIKTDAVHINRIIPIQYKDSIPFLQNIVRDQQKYLKVYHQTFGKLKIWESEYLDHEPIGLEGLLNLAEVVYKNTPVEEILNPMNRIIINPGWNKEKKIASEMSETTSNSSTEPPKTDHTPDNQSSSQNKEPYDL